MTKLPDLTPWGGHQWYLPATGSTMDQARELEALGEPSGTLVRTDHQSAGVGRFAERRWTSAAGESLLFTVFWNTSVFAAANFAPSLILGWGVCHWLESLVAPGVHVAMKWPNDIYLDDRKVAGILVRSRLLSSGRRSLHAGLGINLNQEDFVGEFRNSPVSLHQMGVRLSPKQALAGLLPFLARAMENPDPMTGCEAKLWHLGQEITLTLPGQHEPERGRLLGLGPLGQLKWETSHGMFLVSAGE